MVCSTTVYSALLCSAGGPLMSSVWCVFSMLNGGVKTFSIIIIIIITWDDEKNRILSCLMENSVSDHTNSKIRNIINVKGERVENRFPIDLTCVGISRQRKEKKWSKGCRTPFLLLHIQSGEWWTIIRQPRWMDGAGGLVFSNPANWWMNEAEFILNLINNEHDRNVFMSPVWLIYYVSKEELSASSLVHRNRELCCRTTGQGREAINHNLISMFGEVVAQPITEPFRGDISTGCRSLRLLSSGTRQHYWSKSLIVIVMICFGRPSQRRRENLFSLDDIQ